MKKLAAIIGVAALTGSAMARADVSETWDSASGSVKSAFEQGWDAVSSGAHDTARAGEWVVDKTRDGAMEAWHDVRPGSHETPRNVEDATIQASVERRLESDRHTSAHAIHVQVDEGVVTLRGHVSGPSEARTATRLATETSGVTRVVSRLRWS